MQARQEIQKCLVTDLMYNAEKIAKINHLFQSPIFYLAKNPQIGFIITDVYKTGVILNKADFAQCGTSVRPAVYYITNPGDGTRKLISEVSNRSCLPSDIPELKRGRLEKKSKSHNLQPLIFTTTSNICLQIKTALASKRSSYLLVDRPIYVLGIPLYSGVDRPMKLQWGS